MDRRSVADDRLRQAALPDQLVGATAWLAEGDALRCRLYFRTHSARWFVVTFDGDAVTDRLEA